VLYVHGAGNFTEDIPMQHYWRDDNTAAGTPDSTPVSL
jgi:hypothetical protein